MRQHHWNADRVIETVNRNNPVSSRICAVCHLDADPANYSTVGENVKPACFGTGSTNANNLCNSIVQHEVNENFDNFNFEGMDNDGDAKIDCADRECRKVNFVSIRRIYRRKILDE